jgi:hypothetical protein
MELDSLSYRQIGETLGVDQKIWRQVGVSREWRA